MGHHWVHAHVVVRSRDCDGDYECGWTDVMTTTEQCDPFGDLAFKERVMSNVVDLTNDGMLEVQPDGINWSQQTEEGYRNTDAVWCEAEDCLVDITGYRRDFSAERAGY